MDDYLLPLKASKLQRIALIGPHVEENQLGPYFVHREPEDSYLAALQRHLPEVDIVHAPGCRITGPILKAGQGELNQRDPGKDHNVARLSTAEEDVSLREHAVRMLESSDVIVLCLGDDAATTKESFRARPHGDRATSAYWDLS